MFAGDKIFEKNPDFVSREIAEEFILVPIRRSLKSSDSLYVLNPTGAAFWRSLDGRTSLAEIARGISGEFDVTPDRVEKDLAVLLEDLVSIQAVREAGV